MKKFLKVNTSKKNLKKEDDTWDETMSDSPQSSTKLSLLGSIASKYDYAEFIEGAIALIEQLDQIQKQYGKHGHICHETLKTRKDSKLPVLVYISEKRMPTIHFLAPEMTEKINKIPDYRSDYYSMGIAFYNILSNNFPFTGENMLEIMFAHIVQKPDPIEYIPKSLEAITFKMLEKSQDKRYQSCHGILADLRKAEKLIKESMHGETFELGEDDYSGKLVFSQKLYGREYEIETLYNELENMETSNKSKLVSIYGFSGIGKSAVVREVQKMIIEKKGHFLTGKWEQTKSTEPYSAFQYVFQQLINDFFEEDEEVIKSWKTAILETLGDRARVLVDFMPCFHKLLGDLPAIDELKGRAALDRFNIMISQFLACIASPEHPVIVFVDDAQWADSASLDLMKTILFKNEIKGLILVTAYRDNEVTDSTHPFRLLLSQVEKEVEKVEHIEFKITPLEKQSVQEMLTDMLLVNNHAKVSDLASILIEKTNGNPFFIRAMIQKLYDTNMLYWNNEEKKWIWCITDIKDMELSNNVVHFLTERIEELDQFVIKILQICSVIGHTFDRHVIEHLLHEQSSEKIEAAFSAAEKKELIIPVIDKSTLMNVESTQVKVKYYRWAHDRVQQSAYEMIDDEQKKVYHYQIGISMKHEADKQNDLQEKLFQVTDHFNEAGAEKYVSDDEILMVVRLNGLAAQLALDQVAYKAGNSYAQFGMALLSEDDIFEKDPELAYQLYMSRARCEYSLGNSQEGIAYVNKLKDRVTNPDKIAEVCQLVMQSKIALGKFEEALTDGIYALRELGVKLPLKIKQIHELDTLVRFLYCSKLKGAKHYMKMKRMQSQRDIIILQILNEVFMIGSVLGRDSITMIAITKGLEYSLKHGVHAETPFAFCALVLSAIGFFKEAAKFNLLAEQISNEFDSSKQLAISYFLSFGYISHLAIPYLKLKDYYEKCHSLLLKSGQSLMWGFSENTWHCYMMERFAVMDRFSKIENSYKLLSNYSASDRQSAASMTLFLAFYSTIKGVYNESITDLTGEHYTSEYYWGVVKEYGDSPHLTFYHYFCEGILAYFDFDYKSGLQFTNACKIDNIIKVQVLYADHLLLRILCAAHLGKYSLCRKLLKPLEKRATLCYENYGIYYFLALSGYLACKMISAGGKKVCSISKAVADEYNRISNGIRIKANKKYSTTQIFNFTRAVCAEDMGESQASPYFQALADRIIGEYYATNESNDIAKMYLSESVQNFKTWGGDAVAARMIEEYDFLSDTTGVVKNIEFGESNNVGEIQDQIDINTIVAATRALAREHQLEAILKMLLKLTMKNAGAEYGVLMSVHEVNASLHVVATGSISAFVNMDVDDESQDGIEIKSVTAGAISEYKVAKNLVNLAFNSKGSVIVKSVKEDERVKRNRSISPEAKSIFVLPLVNQAKVLGILYLENHSITHAFTQHHIRILEIVGAQAAISIQKANVFNNMEHLIKIRTDQVKELLHKVYPAKILERIDRGGERKLIDEVKDCSIFFSDIVKFTNFTNRNSVAEVHSMLDAIFTKIDFISSCLSIEKIKTIGDAYVALCGAPTFNPNHAINMAEFALCCQDAVNQYNESVEVYNDDVESHNLMIDPKHVRASERGYTAEEEPTLCPLSEAELRHPIHQYNRSQEMYNRDINRWNESNPHAHKHRRLDKILMRIGLNRGPIIAGVFTETRPIYDILGDTVNTACRMESHGEPERVHVSEEYYEAAKNYFHFEFRGEIPIKGKGLMKTYFLTGRKHPCMLTDKQQKQLLQTGSVLHQSSTPNTITPIKKYDFSLSPTSPLKKAKRQFDALTSAVPPSTLTTVNSTPSSKVAEA